MGTDSGEDKKPTEQADLDKLHEALRESTSRLSRSLMTFVLALLYLLIVVAATTDLQLLLPDSRVKLPVMGIELDLIGFFIFAPALVLILHFAILLHMLHHVAKLKAWAHATSNEEKVLIPSFILNYTHSFQKQPGHYNLMRVLQGVILVVSPLFLLLYVQIRFADYHSLSMTTWHFVVISLDIFLLYVYWVRETPLDFRNEVVIGFRKILFGNFKTRISRLKDLWKQAGLQYKLMFIPIWLLSLCCLTVVGLITTDLYWENNVFLPRLEVTGETLVKSPPSDVILHAYLTRGLSADSAWADHANGVDLRGRDLRFADLYRSKLPKALLQGACLDGADLSESQLNGASLSRARLNGARLCDAELNGADLWGAELNGADLWGVELNGADLTYAELNGADLTYAELNGAWLGEAELNGAWLSDAELNGADLSITMLNGANLLRAELNGANLENAVLNGAFLTLAGLNGADLSRAQLNGANLEWSGVNGALLYETELNGAYLERTRLRGSLGFDIGHAKGVFFSEGPDLDSIPNWDRIAADSILIPSGWRREDFVSRIDTARTFADSLDPALQNIRPDSASFLEKRKQLACENTWVALGLLRQTFRDGAMTSELRESLLNHMLSNCPDSLELIRKRVSDGSGWWNEWVRDQIDAFMREKKMQEAQ